MIRVVQVETRILTSSVLQRGCPTDGTTHPLEIDRGPEWRALHCLQTQEEDAGFNRTDLKSLNR